MWNSAMMTLIFPRLNKHHLLLPGFFVVLFSAGIRIGGGTILVFLPVFIIGFDFKKVAGMKNPAICCCAA